MPAMRDDTLPVQIHTQSIRLDHLNIRSRFMAKQMLIDATRGKKTEKAPWVPYAGVNCAFLINERADRYFKDPDVLARGVVEAAKTYHADGIPLMFDLSSRSGIHRM